MAEVVTVEVVIFDEDRVESSLNISILSYAFGLAGCSDRNTCRND